MALTSIRPAVIASIPVFVAVSPTLVTLSIPVHLIPIIVVAVMVLDDVLTCNNHLLRDGSRRWWKRLRNLGNWWVNSIGNLFCTS